MNRLAARRALSNALGFACTSDMNAVLILDINASANQSLHPKFQNDIGNEVLECYDLAARARASSIVILPAR